MIETDLIQKERITRLVKSGKLALNDLNHLIMFIKLWNESDVIMKSEPEIFEILDDLNKKYCNNIKIGYSPKTQNITLRYFEDFNNLIDFFENRKKFPTETIEGWLKYRRKLEGESPIITFQMIDPRTDKLSEFHIFNSKSYSFNNSGLSPAGFKPRGMRRILFDTLMEKITLPSKNCNSKVKLSLENGLRKSLGINNPINVQILSVYRFDRDKDRIDDFFEYIFWKYYEIKRHDWVSQWNSGKSPVLKRIYEYYKIKGRSFIDADFSSDLKESKVKFYLNNQSEKLKEIKLIIEKNKLQDYNRSNFLQFYKQFQQINHSNILKLEKTFRFKEIQSYSIKSAIGVITDKLSDFKDESNIEGITRAIAAVIQHEKLRSEITKLTKYHPFFKQLDLSERVFSDDKWGRVVTNQRNTIDFPDIVTYNKNSLLAQEKIQLKVLPHSPTKYLKYRYEEILSDYLKSIGCHDPRTNTGLISLRIEYLPPMTYLPSLGRLPSKDHTILIHYWGRMNKRFQRLGEIYNAIRLAIFNHNITEKKKIVEFVKENLSKGSEMLSGRKFLKVKDYVIFDLISTYTEDMCEREFIFQLVIKILYDYSSILLD